MRFATRSADPIRRLCSASGVRPSSRPGAPTSRLIGALALLLGATAACSTDRLPPDPTGAQDQPVVYGNDDRTEVYAHPDASLRTLAQESIVALVSPSDIDASDPSHVHLNSPTLQSAYNLCSDQRFLTEPTAAFCSGTLVDSDLVLTAGHCITTQSACRNTRIVFNYYYASAGTLATITSADVYSCSSIVARQQTNTVDYAVIRLDRAVTSDRHPVPVASTATALSNGTPLSVIGFGSGLPAQIDSGGQVLDARASTLDYFVADLDTFGGNSGSGVFDDTGTLVGVLVRGETDYVSRGGCNVVNVLSDPPPAGSGEESTYAYRAVQAACSAGITSTRLCGGPPEDGWCTSCTTAADCQDGWDCQPLTDVDQLGCVWSCSSDADCRADHHCGDSGVCEPDLGSVCQDGNVWQVDACGRSIAMTQQCAADERCQAAACVPRSPGDICADATAITATSQTLTGDLTTYLDDTQGSCGGAGPDRVYSFTVTAATNLVATVSGFDTVLYLRTTCDDAASEVACNNDIANPTNLGSSITQSLDAGSYALIVDAAGPITGTYSLTLDFSPVCPTTCDLGARRCQAGNVEACTLADTGCHVWTTAEVCGSDQICQAGACVDVCSDACPASGDTQCADASHQQTCGDTNGDGCLEWGPAQTCPSGQACSADTGACACVNACTSAGTHRCNGNTVEACTADANGCLDWAPLTTCATTQVCQDGTCQSICPAACPLGQRRCSTATPGTVESCALDTAGCATWQTAEVCADTERCQSGACTPICTDACTDGQRRCNGDGYQVCQATDAGCLGWGPVVSCAGLGACVAGACTAGCTDACQPDGLEQCVGDAAQRICADTNGDGCLEWSPPNACADGGQCRDGSCTTCPMDGYEPDDVPDDALDVIAGVTGDLFTCPDDEDWYTVPLAAGDALRVEADTDPTAGALDLELWNAAADLRLAVATSADGVAAVATVAESDGRVLVHVLDDADVAIAYSLTVDIVPGGDSGCPPGARRCGADGSAVEECEDPEGDGLYDWQTVDQCEGGCLADATCAGLPWDGFPDVGRPDAGLIVPGADAGAALSGADGCGCTAAQGGEPPAAWLLLALAALLVLPRRCRR